MGPLALLLLLGGVTAVAAASGGGASKSSSSSSSRRSTDEPSSSTPVKSLAELFPGYEGNPIAGPVMLSQRAQGIGADGWGAQDIADAAYYQARFEAADPAVLAFFGLAPATDHRDEDAINYAYGATAAGFGL